MAFQPKEVQQLFLQANRTSLSLRDAEILVSETEGWIAAIQMSGGQPGNLSKVDPLRSTRELFDFFSKEVLARQPGNIQRFLLMTSFLEHFDVTLCEEVLTPLLTDEDDLIWGPLFEIVRQENLFSILVDDDGRWMRYHHLFQHFLRSRLRYTEPALAWHIQQNLARAYEKREAWEEALQIYAELDDNKNLSRLLSQTGSVFIRGGRVLTLASWLDRLATETIYSQPALLSLQGVVYAARGENGKAVEFYTLAEERLRVFDDATELAVVLLRRAEAYRHLGQFDNALLDAEVGLKLTENTETLVLKMAYAEAQRTVGLSYFGQGHLKKALTWLNGALHTYRLMGATSNIPILETELGVVYRRLGQPDKTARYYASALDAWKNIGNTGWKARLLNNLGLLYHTTGRLGDALPLLEEALQVAERSGYVWLRTNEFISLGDLWTDLGDFDIAHEYYDKALTSATQLGDSLLIFYATLGEARLKRLQGEFSQALIEYEQTEINLFRLK
jgi:tetratricopeptide (TPR) repeat protein